MKKIIIINGFPQSGKDTFANYMQEILGNDNCKIISSVDKVKEAAKLLGWNEEKTEENRKVLSDLKNLSISNWDGPFQYLKETVDNNNYQWYIVFVREPEEIKKIQDNFKNVFTIYVSRENSLKVNNTSDMNVGKYSYDYLVNNNYSFRHLKENAKKIINNIIKISIENKIGRFGEIKEDKYGRIASCYLVINGVGKDNLAITLIDSVIERLQKEKEIYERN